MTVFEVLNKELSVQVCDATMFNAYSIAGFKKGINCIPVFYDYISQDTFRE
ncbi:hypothetical protein BH11BAC6_BH11BAC6_13210 [soil metagenome]